ncbi:MAG: ABC transporter permease, partial [Candidatus Nanopelagicales bacterium]
MIAQAAFELRLLLRNGEQFLLTVVIPLALLLAATFVAAVPLSGAPGTARLPAALGGVLAVAIIASAFTSLAISVGFDRRSGALVMLATTPLSRMSILGARLMATLVVVGLQTLLLVGLSLVLGWRP